jgi:hypothetical protein
VAALALIAAQCFLAAPAEAAVPLPVSAAYTAGGKTTLVVDLSASSEPGRSATVTLRGADQPATLIPALSPGLALSLVVDTSQASAASLPAWLSGAARLILEAPDETDAVVISDSAPAAVVVAPQRGALEVVRGLDKVASHGTRDTANALKLAAGQFPHAAAGRRVAVYYTSAADAGGISAAALGAEFRATQTMLVVVGTADNNPYWAEATAATGGFFAPAGNPAVVPALDQVQAQLRGRYLVQFATPAALPATVSVKVTTGDLTMVGDVPVPSADRAPGAGADDGSGSGLRTGLLWGAIAAVVLALIAGAVVLLRRRAEPEVAQGRATVPEQQERSRPVSNQSGRRRPGPNEGGPDQPALGRATVADSPSVDD